MLTDEQTMPHSHASRYSSCGHSRVHACRDGDENCARSNEDQAIVAEAELALPTGQHQLGSAQPRLPDVAVIPRRDEVAASDAAEHVVERCSRSDFGFQIRGRSDLFEPAGVRIATRSQRASTSSMAWVVIKIVAPNLVRRSRTWSHTVMRATGSSPTVG